MTLLQLAMGMVVNFFFGGFVMGKIPFALSPRFKPMLQVRVVASGGAGALAARPVQGLELAVALASSKACSGS